MKHCLVYLYAFKCNLKELTTKSLFSAKGQRYFDMRMASNSLHRSCDSVARGVFLRAVLFIPRGSFTHLLRFFFFANGSPFSSTPRGFFVLSRLSVVFLLVLFFLNMPRHTLNSISAFRILRFPPHRRLFRHHYRQQFRFPSELRLCQRPFPKHFSSRFRTCQRLFGRTERLIPHAVLQVQAVLERLLPRLACL